MPHPHKAVPLEKPDLPPSPVWVSSREMRHSSFGDATSSLGGGSKKGKEKESNFKHEGQQMLTLEELALLPLCGVPAYRAVRTFMYAFPGQPDSASNQNTKYFPEQRQQPHLTSIQGRSQPCRRRALVLRGHDGAGAMAVQMLIQQGWRVSVHIPFSCVPAGASQAMADAFMRAMEERARGWGADEVIFDDGEAVREGGDVEGGGDGDDGRAAAVRVIETLREDGDMFDAVLDTVGGKEVREAGERLLRLNGISFSSVAEKTPSGSLQNSKLRRYGLGQFTTIVGDTPERPIPSVADALRANLRNFRFGQGHNSGPTSKFAEGGSSAESHNGTADADARSQKVGYAWVSVAHEVEWEGEDIGETLDAVLRLAMEEGIRPLVEDAGGGTLGKPRVVPFEKAPGVFVSNGPLADGGTVVVKIAG